ncbi:MAG: hypothetical protein ACI9EF_002834 [Pseudohongiellaceae bacterium]|jgi:hypothetical protein
MISIARFSRFVCLASVTLAALLGCDPGVEKKPAPSAEPPLALAEPAELSSPEQAQHMGWRARPHDDTEPPTARWDMVEGMRLDLQAERHPSDGGGRAWLAETQGWDSGATVGQAGRWTIRYEAGPLGVAEGGVVYLQVSPYWGWSWPVVDDGRIPADVVAEQPGFTTVTTDAEGVIPLARAVEQQLMAVIISGRELRAGEGLTITYGAGPSGAHPDRFAEADSPFWIAVDGDGDGIRKLLDKAPRVAVAPGPAARMQVTVTSCVRPGDEARLTVAVLDGAANTGIPWQGTVSLGGLPSGTNLPESITFDGSEQGRQTLTFQCSDEGTWWIEASTATGLQAQANPLVVQAEIGHVLWGDLHGHSGLSDGTGTPEDYFTYARDVAALDVVSLTDHDHWGFQFLDAHPEMWEQISDTVAAYHEPGRFVTVPGYEWTSWIHGHRHVLSFEDEPSLSVLSSLDERYETPRQLWDALAGQDALTFAHHSAGGPIAVNWTYRPDPLIEPVTEIVSVHGSSEALDSPLLIYRPQPGYFVRDVLDAGMRFGFVGSGDSHDGHPGLAHLANPSGAGGLVALLTDDFSRSGVLNVLRERRCYATSGARMIVRSSLGGTRMGGTLQAPDAPVTVTLLAWGTAPIVRVDLIRSGAVIGQSTFDDETSAFVATSWELTDLQAGEYVYLRVLQADKHVAWTSPFSIE